MKIKAHHSYSRDRLLYTASLSFTALLIAAVVLMSTAYPVYSAEKPKAMFNMAESEKVDGLRVVTIGVAGPPMAKADTTWSATLVQFGDKNFLVDVGAAATHGLLAAGVRPSDVTHLLFTHHHADHNSDYFTYAIGGWSGPAGRRVSNIVGPENTQELHDMMLKFYDKDISYRMNYGWSGDGLVTNVNIKTVKGGETFDLNGVKVTTTTGVHTLENIVYRFDYEGQSVVVTGDSAYTENIINISKGVDILVIDTHMAEGVFATNVLSKQVNRDNMRKAHMSNEDIAKIAKMANPGKLILTHLPPGKIDVEATIKIIKDAGYMGEVFVAEPAGKYVAN